MKESVEAFKQDFARFEALQRDGRPDEVAHAQKDLLSQLKTLNWDMDDLSDAITVVEKNRSKYTLSDDELARRKRFVADTRAAIGRMKSAVQDATGSSGGAVSHRNELLRGRQDRGGGGGGGGGYGPPEGVSRDVEGGGGLEQQQMVLKQQDMVLDDVISATKRLGEMGATIGEELGQQSRLISEVRHFSLAEILVRSLVNLFSRPYKTRGLMLTGDR